MNKIGFIGYGNMGKMIIDGILSKEIIKSDEMIISTRSMEKLDELKINNPKISITYDKKVLARKCDKIFLMVNTNQLKDVLEEITPYLSPDAHIIYISAGINIKDLECIFPGKITHVIPSITSKVRKGITLIAHNDKVSETDLNYVNFVFNGLGETKIISEDNMAMATVLTSCFPAFISLICKKYSEQAAIKGSLSESQVEDLVKVTLDGTSTLLLEMDFDELISGVATRGGITESGLKILDKELPILFSDLFKAVL
ncbi:MAG: pyrroline-5-carboxylate reductase family protein [Methanomicrobiales archaeon]